MTEPIKEIGDDPVLRARARLMSIVWFFVGLLKYVGLFFVGIIVGMGIVLKNPLPNKEQQKEINLLKKENEELRSKLVNVDLPVKNPDVKDKNSFVID
jgi:hypothetical protein